MLTLRRDSFIGNYPKSPFSSRARPLRKTTLHHATENVGGFFFTNLKDTTPIPGNKRDSRLINTIINV